MLRAFGWGWVVALGVVVGCGRSSTFSQRCVDSDGCAAGGVCQSGVCVYTGFDASAEVDTRRPDNRTSGRSMPGSAGTAPTPGAAGGFIDGMSGTAGTVGSRPDVDGPLFGTCAPDAVPDVPEWVSDTCLSCACERSPREVYYCNSGCWDLIACVLANCSGLAGVDRTTCAVMNCDVTEGAAAMAASEAIIGCAPECFEDDDGSVPDSMDGGSDDDAG